MNGTLWSMIYVIMVFLTDFLSEKWEYSNFEAGNFFFPPYKISSWSVETNDSFYSQLIILIIFLGVYSSIVFFVGVPVSIGTGWFISKNGRSITLIVLAGALFAWSCLVLGLTNMNPLAGIIGIGIATGMKLIIRFLKSTIILITSVISTFFILFIFDVTNSVGFFEPTVNCALARVLPEEGSDTAYSFAAIIFQVILFVAPFFFGYVHDDISSER